MCGTELAYGATRSTVIQQACQRLCRYQEQIQQPPVWQVRPLSCAVSGTDVDYAIRMLDTRRAVLSAAMLLHVLATQWAVLSAVMLVPGGGARASRDGGRGG
eukprot:2882889-Rhodomonas_salina.1